MGKALPAHSVGATAGSPSIYISNPVVRGGGGAGARRGIIPHDHSERLEVVQAECCPRLRMSPANVAATGGLCRRN